MFCTKCKSVSLKLVLNMVCYLSVTRKRSFHVCHTQAKERVMFNLFSDDWSYGAPG